jgi:Macrocin-O-methyltransferase (TylF)
MAHLSPLLKHQMTLRRKVTSLVSQTVLDQTLRPYVMRAAKEQFRHFGRARQLRATLDSADYAEANMAEAAVYTDKLAVLEHGIAQARRDGLFMEFGVWSGRTINFIAERRVGPVHGFDSFEGLPEDWTREYRRGDFSTDGRLPDVRSNVRLHKGWFDQTLPEFLRENSEPVAFLHIDCDLYSSTRTIFDLLVGRIGSGTVIVFDEYFNYPGWREHEHKAFREFLAEHGLSARYLAYNEADCNVAAMIA